MQRFAVGGHVDLLGGHFKVIEFFARAVDGNTHLFDFRIAQIKGITGSIHEVLERHVGGGDVVEQLSRSSAADFGLRGELPYIDAVISAITDEPNIVEKERKIDAIRWSEAEEIAVFDYFDINYILSYLVKVNIVARWTLLSPEVGRQMLNRFIESLDAKELVNKQ